VLIRCYIMTSPLHHLCHLHAHDSTQVISGVFGYEEKQNTPDLHLHLACYLPSCRSLAQQRSLNLNQSHPSAAFDFNGGRQKQIQSNISLMKAFGDKTER
jgi:hypothetical protein